MNEIEEVVLPLLRAVGFVDYGWFRFDDKRIGLLIGNVGSAMWEPFSSSSIASDGGVDPLNRWTQSVVNPIGETGGAEVVYPFGEAVWPFQQWAKQAMGLKQSPLGLLMHPDYGLWFAFRATLLIENSDWQSAMPMVDHACDGCVEKPCLKTCPVGAISIDEFDVGRCRDHLKSGEGGGCLTGGCIARRACPIGRGYVYEPDHQAFHMTALS